ncbi:MAG TPA: APC family permease [Streptosporangiaceae bacterium]|nr:APC family permease [Streptosporangiaceae bacterium]
MTSSEASVPAGATKAGGTESTRLFIRQTSGLVRELGIPAATGISLASVAVVNTFINFNAGLTDFTKSDMYLPLVAAAVIWLVAMFAYRYLLRAVPRAGGEYVYLSRIVSPAAGSVAGLGIAVVFTYVLSTNAHFAAQFTPFMLSGLGAAFHSTAVANAGTHLTSNIAIAWLSVVVMLIVAALSLFSVKIVARIIFWLIALQVLAFVVLIGMLAFNSHADFTSALATYSNHPGAFQDIISAAKSNGVVFGTSIASAVAIIPFMVLNYNGVLYSYYVGGELRRPGRTYLYASAISIGVLVVLWVGVWALLRARVGLTFMQAQANLSVVNPTAYGKITGLNSVAGGLGYGMILSGDPITKILFATAVPLAEIAVNLAFLTVTTRVLFAQAFDRLLPVGVAKISDRNHAPNVAISIVLVIGIGFCFLTSLVNLGSIVALQSLFFALILLAGGIAATALPLRRADLIETPGMAPDARKKWLRQVTMVGGATLVLALFTVYELVAHSSVYGKFSWESILTLVIVLGAGPVIYLIARQVRRQRNSLDLTMAMRELPPE